MVKFGSQIKNQTDPGQYDHCIAYENMKNAIYALVPDKPEAKKEGEEGEGMVPGAGGMTPAARFHSLLQHELLKVNRYFNLLLRALMDTLRQAQTLALADSLGADQVTQLERTLDTAGQKLDQIVNFRRLNFTGFQKILKKFDKQAKATGVGGSLSSWFLPKLMREAFAAEPLDVALLLLAWGYAALRRHRGTPAATVKGAEAAPSGAGAATASTNTLWLRPAMRMSALCSLVKRFELVVPPTAGEQGEAAFGTLPATGRQIAERMKSLLQMAPEAARMACQLSAQNKMIYYDSATFEQYAARLSSGQPTGFRSRQTTSSKSATTELVECDGVPSALSSHAFTPVAQLRSSDAFVVTSDAGVDTIIATAAKVHGGDIPEADELSANDVKDVKAFAQKVMAQLPSLTCVASVTSSRVVLRGDTPETEGISVGLDEDVRFSRDASNQPRDAVDFTYNLMEVAAASGEAAGAWLEEMRGFGAVREVDGFCVGAHAVASLHKDSVPMMPAYYENLNKEENWTPENAWSLQREWRAAMEEAQQEGGDAGKALQSMMQQTAAKTAGKQVAPALKAAPKAAPKAAAKAAGPPLEPKSYMASERTMLEWIHTVLCLAFLGIALWRYSLNIYAVSGPKPIAGGLLNGASLASAALGVYALVLVGISVVFAWYAVISHGRRVAALRAGKLTEGIFNSRKGPVAFTSMVGAALTMHLLVQALPLFFSVGDLSAAGDM